MTLSAKGSLILGENKATFRREGHKFLLFTFFWACRVASEMSENIVFARKKCIYSDAAHLCVNTSGIVL